jgi:hypothetical protein
MFWNVVFFLLGDSSTSEFYVPMFRVTRPIQLGRCRPLSWGDSRFTAYLVDSYRSREKESGKETWSAGTSPKKEVVPPSGMEFCCTSSSSVLWWTTRAPSGSPQLAHVSGNCRCFSPSVFALLTMHFGTLVTSKVTKISELLSLSATSDL